MIKRLLWLMTSAFLLTACGGESGDDNNGDESEAFLRPVSNVAGTISSITLDELILIDPSNLDLDNFEDITFLDYDYLENGDFDSSRQYTLEGDLNWESQYSYNFVGDTLSSRITEFTIYFGEPNPSLTFLDESNYNLETGNIETLILTSIFYADQGEEEDRSATEYRYEAEDARRIRYVLEDDVWLLNSIIYFNTDNSTDYIEYYDRDEMLTRIVTYYYNSENYLTARVTELIDSQEIEWDLYLPGKRCFNHRILTT